MSNKVRVVLSVDKDIYETFKENLKDYPRGVASWVVEKTFDDINTKFELMGGDSYIDAMFSRKK